MAVSKSQQRAVNKYVREKYDRINVTMPKGRKELIQDHAAAIGESVNAYINAAIDERMARDTPASPSETPTAQEMAGVVSLVSLPSSALKAAQEAAEAAGEAVPVFVARAVETQAQRDILSRRMKGGEQS